MNRPFLRELAKRAGYSVHQRSSCYGRGPTYDWGPKPSMMSRHFPAEETAWANLEEAIYAKLVDAETLIRLSGEIIKEGNYNAPGEST